MTDQQKRDFFLFLQKFCADNAGNRLNEWIIEAFLNRANQKLSAIHDSQACQDVSTRSGKRKEEPCEQA